MIRNFITTLRQFALSSILNIIGLSVTISAFILIMMQVNYEYSVGTSDPRHKNIYRLESKNQGESMWGITIHPRIYENFLKCTPQVEEHAEFLYSSTTIKVEELVYKNIPQTLIISDISKLFHVEMKEGVFSSVMDPGNVVVSESLAKKLFGTVSAIGKKIDDKVVSGVCKDFGPASIITDGMFVKSYSGSYASSFCYLSDNIDTKAIVENFKALAKRDLDGFGITDMKLVAIKDNYFDNNFVKNSFVKRGNITITNILLSVAILIIIIAIINFINFSTALAPVRIKDLNTRSVLGSSRQALRWRIIAEALCFTLVSYVIALAIVDIVVKTSLLGLFKADDMSILTNIGVVLAVFVLSIVIGCIAGLYPAFYSTSFEPSLVLNGSYKLSAGGNYLSFGLIGFQFLVSMALIIIAFFVGLQNKYIEDKDLGYRDENVVLVSSIYDQAKLSVIESRIKKLAGVKGTARYNGSFGVYNGDMISDIVFNGDTVHTCIYFVQDGFLELMGVPLIKGRSFRSTDKPLIDYQSGEMDALPTVVLNESALRAFHSSVDSVIVSSGSSFHVIGVVPDVITTSMHSAVEPIMYAKDSNCKELVVKVEGKSANDAIAGIRNIVKEIEPSEYWSVKFYDKYLAEMYVNERDLSMLITLFSFLAIIISLMGVFGLVAFETQRRRREISLRRINGASVAEVVIMFNRRFTLLVAISFVVAAPLAYYAVEQWLSGFAYRTPIYVWVFAVALLIVFIITFLTVTIKSLNAAVENPIETLKR